MKKITKLKKWQIANGVSDKTLADAVGIHPSLISHYHAGRRGFSKHTARAISEYTHNDVSILDLLF